MSDVLTTRDALIIAAEGSQDFHQKAASAIPNTALQPDTILPTHIALRDEMVKIASSIQKNEPNNGFVEILVKTAELVGQGFPAKPVAAQFTGDDKETYEKIAGAIDDLSEAILIEKVHADYDWLKRRHLIQKTASSPTLAQKYPHLAKSLPKFKALAR
jgi:hypothetical protein